MKFTIVTAKEGQLTGAQPAKRNVGENDIPTSERESWSEHNSKNEEIRAS